MPVKGRWPGVREDREGRGAGGGPEAAQEGRADHHATMTARRTIE